MSSSYTKDRYTWDKDGAVIILTYSRDDDFTNQSISLSFRAKMIQSKAPSKKQKGWKRVFCSKCGTKIPDDSRYCYKCGEKILESMDDSSNTMDKVPEKGNDNTIVDRSVEVKRNTELDSPKQIHKEKQSKDGYLFSKEYWLTWQGRRNRKPYFFII